MSRPHPATTIPITDSLVSGFRDERARRFLSAMRRCPDARTCELDGLAAAIRRLGARDCERIIDLGAGHGYATDCLLQFLQPTGVVYAVDTSEEMLAHLPAHPRVMPLMSSLDRLSCLAADSIDLAVTLATFHHVVNKNQVLLEIRRVLRPGGCLVIADVADHTPTQRFFDEIVRYHCVTGHEADFLTEAWIKMIAERAGLEWVSSTLEETPWRFARPSDLLAFVHDLFALTLDINALHASVEDILSTRIDPESRETLLSWTLCYHALRKRAGGSRG
jgi:ubiquinone/menaquinone biosynthesis C-methylase UbiE